MPVAEILPVVAISPISDPLKLIVEPEMVPKIVVMSPLVDISPVSVPPKSINDALSVPVVLKLPFVFKLPVSAPLKSIVVAERMPIRLKVPTSVPPLKLILPAYKLPAQVMSPSELTFVPALTFPLVKMFHAAIFPFTSSFIVGVVVPMPTFCPKSI